MAVARVYRMQAVDGQGDAMEAALLALRPTIAKVKGSLGIEVLRDPESPLRFLFIEKWDSVESHKAAFDQMPPGALDRLQQVMAGPPDGAYYTYLDA